MKQLISEKKETDLKKEILLNKSIVAKEKEDDKKIDKKIKEINDSIKNYV